MSRNITNQKSILYFIDAESNQLITDTLTYNYQPRGEHYLAYDPIYGGTMLFEFSMYNEEAIQQDWVFELDEDRVTELGYDYKSITGNIAKASYCSKLDAYCFPSVAIIYMSKLK